MRILLTSILCQSGLMTHVKDLVSYLTKQGIFTAIAFKRVNYLHKEAAEQILQKLADVPFLLYDTVDELEKFITLNKCTMIHAHSCATFQSVTEASFRFDLPLIVTLHSVFSWGRVYGTTLNATRKIIAVGPAQAHSARDFRQKIELVQNGIDTTFFAPKEYRKHDEQKINVLWYGRVDKRLARGLRVLDRVAPLLPKGVRVTALGTSDYHPRNIPLIPWTNDPLPYLQQSHVTFAHSRSLREAMASGSIGMLLGHGYGGIVTGDRLQNETLVLDAFPEYRLPRPRVSRILQDLLAIMGNANIQELRQDARSIAERHFALDTMGQRITDIYRIVRE